MYCTVGYPFSGIGWLRLTTNVNVQQSTNFVYIYACKKTINNH